MATENSLIPNLLNLKRTLVDCNSRLEDFQKSKLEEAKRSKLEELQKNELEKFQKSKLKELKDKELGVETQEEVKPSTTFHPENEQQQKIKRVHDRRRAGRRTMRSSGSSIEDESIPEEDYDEGRLQMSTVFDDGFEDCLSKSFIGRQKSESIPSENASESFVFGKGFCFGSHASNVSVPRQKHKLKIRSYKPRRYIVKKEVFYPQANSSTSSGIHFLVICVGVLMLQISLNLLPLIQVQTRAGNIF